MTEDGRKHDEHVVLLGRAPNAAIAGLWASMLEAAGIAYSVPGTYLADEWAATQRMTGNVGSDVFVPESRLEEARRIIAQDAIEPGFDEQAEAAVETEGPPAAAPAPTAPEPEAALPVPTRRTMLIESIAIFGVLFVPKQIVRFFDPATTGFFHHQRWSLQTMLVAIGLAIPVIMLVRWLISRSDEPATRFGWQRPRAADVPAAGMIALITACVVGFAWFLLNLMQMFVPAKHGGSGTSHAPLETGAHPLGWVAWGITIVSLLIGFFAQECAIRGYLMVRLRRLSALPVAALLLTSLGSALIHVEYGFDSVVLNFAGGIVFGVAFFLVKRLWPIAMGRTAFAIFSMIPIDG